MNEMRKLIAEMGRLAELDDELEDELEGEDELGGDWSWKPEMDDRSRVESDPIRIEIFFYSEDGEDSMPYTIGLDGINSISDALNDVAMEHPGAEIDRVVDQDTGETLDTGPTSRPEAESVGESKMNDIDFNRKLMEAMEECCGGPVTGVEGGPEIPDETATFTQTKTMGDGKSVNVTATGRNMDDIHELLHLAGLDPSSHAPEEVPAEVDVQVVPDETPVQDYMDDNDPAMLRNEIKKRLESSWNEYRK